LTSDPTLPTGTILDKIVAAKREELERRRREEPLEVLFQKERRFPENLDLAEALTGPRLRLIAEIKKASPVKGVLDRDLQPLSRARAYTMGGAAAISILTEVPNFMGRIEYLESIRIGLDRYFPGGRPVLVRKDFLFDPYHLHEARAYGADAVLLIVALLPDELLARLIALAAELELGTLVEVHDEEELARALAVGAQVIGINNRDLHTFATTLEVTERLRPLIPTGKVVVSESGLNGAADARRVRKLGVDAVLVGEALMTSDTVVAKMREFMVE
jgi:indole-3-glycerol phosphate synthase